MERFLILNKLEILYNQISFHRKATMWQIKQHELGGWEDIPQQLNGLLEIARARNVKWIDVDKLKVLWLVLVQMVCIDCSCFCE